jgi:putative FmdB family regulatory protein
MPTYAYRCGACGRSMESVHGMAEHKSEMACACGSVATQTYDHMPEFLLKGMPRDFKLDATCVPIGWEHGNTDIKVQQDRYSRKIEGHRKLARQNQSKAIRGGIQHIGSVPRELMRMRQNQYGKDYLNPSATSETELKDQLRSEGLLFEGK